MSAIPASGVVRETHFAGIAPSARGKVRDIYDLGDKLLIVATDRLSAFDVILPTPIPDKGRVLTQLSLFWFDLFKDVIPNHVNKRHGLPCPLRCPSGGAGGPFHGRAQDPTAADRMRRARLCVGFWLERLPSYGENLRHCAACGLQESDRLPAPIFTPSTKAAAGHDENISFEQAAAVIGEELATRVRAISIDLYQRAAAYAKPRGILLADTKFEFGMLDGRTHLDR